MLYDSLPDGMTWQEANEQVAEYLGLVYSPAYLPSIHLNQCTPLINRLGVNMINVDDRFFVSNEIILTRRYENLESTDEEIYCTRTMFCEAVIVLFIIMKEKQILP